MGSWDTSSGLFTKGDITIKKARFGYDASYEDGDVLVIIMEFVDESGEEHIQWYSLGSGWDPVAKGKRAEGKDEFGEGTNYAAFFLAARETDAIEILDERGYPDDATIWEGLKFTVKRKLIERGEGASDSEVLVPTKYLGVEGAKKSGKKEPDKSSGKKKGGSAALKAKVRKIAKAHDDHDDFLIAALEAHPELEEDEHKKLYEDVLDESGLWAKAQK